MLTAAHIAKSNAFRLATGESPEAVFGCFVPGHYDGGTVVSVVPRPLAETPRKVHIINRPPPRPFRFCKKLAAPKPKRPARHR